MSNMNMDETYTANAMANEAENVTVEAKATEVQNNENEGSDWRKVVIGGVTGIVLGASGAYAAERVTIPVGGEEAKEGEAEAGKEEATSGEEPAKITFKGTAPMAHNVNDEMTFSEAFAAARAEVGPGGVFEWHGQLYGTYYAAEWDHMSQDEKDAYRHSVSGAHHHHSNKPTETTTTDAASTDTAEAMPESTDEANVTVDEPAKPAETNHTTTAQEPEVEIALLGQQAVTNPDGTISAVGSMVINGHNAVVVDVDMDGNYDIIGADLNGDGQISEDEISPIAPGALTSDDFDANSLQNATDNMYANLPDYVNDADPSSFA